MATPNAATCAVCELHAEATFRVEGMDCGEEVTLLEHRLKPLTGLEAVTADLINQRLHVKYDAARVTTSAMVEAIGGTGMRMWLEHEKPTSYAHAVEWRWRLVVAALITLAVGAALSFVPTSRWPVGMDGAGVARWFYLAATLLGGLYPARRALVSLRSRSIDINVLMVVAVMGALVLQDWLEAASVVLLFAVAQWLEARTLDRARQAIRALLDLSPLETLVIRGGVEQRVGVDAVEIGDRIVVRPGEKVPLDGAIVSGRTEVNEAPLTGESLPVDKEPGDEVYAGTINGRGAIDVVVRRLRGDTRLARIIHLVELAQGQRAPVQTAVDRFARVYTPAVIAIAVALVLVPWLAGGDTVIWFYRALVLLVVACPCALVISTPVSVVAALAGAARSGVLIKGGAYLERLATVRAVAFDKTGTLTHGELEVVDVRPESPMTAQELLGLASAVEARSTHPIARAIVHHAKRNAAALTGADGVRELPGLGAEGRTGGQAVLVGNGRLFRERGIPVPASSTPGDVDDGRTWVFVASQGKRIGAIAVADRPRAAARETMDLLRHQGIAHIAMLTGDHPQAATRIARALGLDEVHAGLLPEQKHQHIEALRRAHGPVLMVGDGINDAPALAVADVGVAVGAAASDAALETADVALMSDELLKLPYVLRVARATVRNIRANIFISLALKAVFLVLALTGSATLWMAILADTGASVVVVVNALRLLRAR